MFVNKIFCKYCKRELITKVEGIEFHLECKKEFINTTICTLEWGIIYLSENEILEKLKESNVTVMGFISKENMIYSLNLLIEDSKNLNCDFVNEIKSFVELRKLSIEIKGTDSKIINDFNELNQIEELYITINEFETINDSIFNIKSLRYLGIQATLLSKIEVNTVFCNLIELYLENCNLKSIPEKILTESLKKIYINHVPINSLPDKFDKLFNLEEIWIMFTNISKLPRSFLNSKKSVEFIFITHH